MAKIARYGGPTDALVNPPTDENPSTAVWPASGGHVPVPVAEIEERRRIADEANAKLLEQREREAKRERDAEQAEKGTESDADGTGEGERSSRGNSTEASSERLPTPPTQSESDPRQPAREMASPSRKAEKASPSDVGTAATGSRKTGGSNTR